MRELLRDNRGVDTIPLKMVFYLSVTGIILSLFVLSWNNISPVLDHSDADRQLEEAALHIASIQRGHARDIPSGQSPGSMCTVEFSFEDNVEFIAFGVDPDPDRDGNFSDSAWSVEENTIILSYSSGERHLVFIEGDRVDFRKGILMPDGSWSVDTSAAVPAASVENSDKGVVIFSPVSGEYTFEMVFEDSRYTLARF